MIPTIEDLAPIIVSTERLPIESSAKQILEKCNLDNVTAQEVIECIKPFRHTRKGLEACCKAIVAAYQRNNQTPDIPDLRSESDWSGLLGSFNFKP
jgi:hypothetical protein